MTLYSGLVLGFKDEKEYDPVIDEDTERLGNYTNEKILAYRVGTESYPHPHPNPTIRPLSTSFNTRALSCIRGITSILVPSFVPWIGQADANESTTNPTAYLDGMRGMAAFAVFLCHLSYGFWDITHAYGAGKPGENTYILQLPIVRLAYAGPPMVAIFFVISGYALSYKPIKLIRANQLQTFTDTITSSVFRRAFRLFLPCFASTFVVACLCQLGYYDKTEEFALNLRVKSEEHARAKANMYLQLIDWGRQMFRLVNVFDWSLYAGSIALDQHLWTIPAEYRCSMVLFLTLILTARMSSKLRLLTIITLIWWGTHWNRWELVPFWAGALLAEVGHMEVSEGAEASLGCLLENNTIKEYHVCRWKYWTPFYAANFVCGLFLASFPDADGHATPGYIYLNSMIPDYWTEKHRFWPTIAAVQIVWSVSKLRCLRRLFSTPLLQYSGRLSFSLYVIHGPITHTFGYTMMKILYTRSNSATQTGSKAGFALAATIIIVAVIWVSDIFWRVVDKPSIKLARWLEAKMFAC